MSILIAYKSIFPYFGYIYAMPRHSLAITQLSPSAQSRLTLIGQHVDIAVKTRETYQAFSHRVGISRASLRKIIQGDPSIPFGMVVAVLDALGLVDHLDEVAAPERDNLGQSLRVSRGKSRGQPSLDDNF